MSVDVWSQSRHIRRCGRVGTPQHIRTYEADYTHPRRASGCATQRRTRVSRLVRLNRGRGVFSPLLHAYCRQAVLNAGRTLHRLGATRGLWRRWGSRCKAVGQAAGAAQSRSMLPPHAGRERRGAGGPERGPSACRRPRRTGSSGGARAYARGHPAPDAERPGKGLHSRQTRASSPAVSGGRRPRMT